MTPDPPKHASRFCIMLGVTGNAFPSGMTGEAKYLAWSRRKIQTPLFLVEPERDELVNVTVEVRILLKQIFNDAEWEGVESINLAQDSSKWRSAFDHGN